MNSVQQQHPAPAELLAFAHGRLHDREFAEIEEHLSSCDVCCQRMAQQPENTLLALARDVATLGFLEQQPPGAPAVGEIPAALQNHSRYRVIEQIGIGGMGSVYKAEHRLMQRMVALKIVHPWLLSNPQAVERFQREVQLAAKLAHPHIVASYDADQVENLHFLVMEHVVGETLQQRIIRLGPASVEQACEWIRQAARGLQHAHEQGMVHRDIKPHNLMLTSDGQVKILDFGLSRLVAEQTIEASEVAAVPRPSSATQTNMILGTPDYIAPEQISNSRAADIRSDIYSLGCTLYMLLTGRTPFEAPTVVARLHAHESTPFPLLQQTRPDAPLQLDVILSRMIAKRPEARYTAPSEVERDLAALFSGPVSSATAKLILPFKLPPPTKWNVLGLAGALLLVVLASWGIWSLSGAVAAKPATRMLVMLPSKGLWYPDYQGLVDAAESTNTTLVFAGVSEHPSALLNKSPPGIALADVKLGPEVNAKDYQAIIFVGYDTTEFSPEGIAGEETKRLLSDFQRQKKVVASICTGQRVLAKQGALRGKKVSPCSEVRTEEITVAGGRRTTQSVQVDGRLVTAAEVKDAPAFLKAIQTSLQPN